MASPPIAGAPEPGPAPYPPPSRWQRLLGSRGLRLLVGVAVLGWLLLRGIEALGGAEAVRERLGPWAGLLIVPVQVIVSVSPVPGELVAAVNVAVYGVWAGAAFCWLGWMLAAFLEYTLVRRTVRDLYPAAGTGAGPDPSRPADHERLPRWLRRLPAEHPAFLILARYLPFGSHVVNATAGARGVRLARFAWTSAVALVPSSILFAAVTAGLLGLG